MVAFGGTWPAGKVAADHVPPAVIAVSRFASAAVLLWLWARLSGRPVARPRRASLGAGARRHRRLRLQPLLPLRRAALDGGRRLRARSRADPGRHRPAR